MTEADLGAKALGTLIPAGAIYGVAAVAIFRRFTNRLQIRGCVNRIVAHLMELGLFLDSPALVLRAQRDLLRENLRLLRLALLPGGILAVLFALVYFPLNAMYGRAPLEAGEASVVTIEMKNASMPAVELQEPADVVVETPGIRDLRDHRISWRVRALRETSEEPRFRVANRVVVPGAFFINDPDIRSIETGRSKADIDGAPWLAWFAAISSVSALAAGFSWKR